MSQRRERRTYTQEFKQQMVDLLNSGKPRADIIREYELTPSSFDKWVRQAKKTGSFKEADNLTPAEKELIALRKRNQQLEQLRLLNRQRVSLIVLLILSEVAVHLEGVQKHSKHMIRKLLAI